MTREQVLAEAVAIATASALPVPESIEVRASGGYQMGLIYNPLPGRGHRNKLMITRGMLDEAPSDVIRAFTAHEIGHFHDHGRVDVASALALKWMSSTTLSVLIAACLLAGWLTGAQWPVDVAGWAASLAVVVAVPACLATRRQEYRADRFAAGVVGAAAMAAALAWIHERDSRARRIVGALPPVLSTHPRIRARIAALHGLGGQAGTA